MAQPADKVIFPSIAMLVTSVVNIAIGVFAVIGTRVQENTAAERVFKSEAERAGYYAGRIGALLCMIVSMVVAFFIAYAAIQMMQGKSYKSARTAAILLMIPFTSCCFVLGIPVGIWALMILNQPDVKD